MANKVFVNKDGLIEQIYSGRQTFETITKTAAETMLLADRLRASGKKPNFLVNFKNITKVTADALLAASDALNAGLDTKVAIYGGNKYLNDLANLVISAMGKETSVLLFDTKKDASIWLKSSK